MKKNPLTDKEREFIKDNALSMTDQELADRLKRDIRTVVRARRKAGVKKTAQGKIQAIRTADGKEVVGSKLTENQREDFFKEQFINTLYYSELKKQLTRDELDFYLAEWGSLCLQFEDIVQTEKRQIEELIKAQIMGNRILRNIKVTEEEILKLQKEIEEFREDKDMATDEDAQDRDETLMRMVQAMSGQSAGMTSDYQRNVDLKQKLLNDLKARRTDRIDSIKQAGVTFQGIVKALRDRQTRIEEGRKMEMFRVAKDKKKNEWRKPHLFPDQTRDPILLDDKAILDDFSRENDLMFKYIGSGGKNILLVENDITRLQFFQDIFKNHTLVYTSTAEAAIDNLNKNSYDLVCLDYDLDFVRKGSDVAECLKDKTSDVLVHSVNTDGINKIKDIFFNKSNIEYKGFYQLVKEIQNENSTTGEEGFGDNDDAGRNSPEGDRASDGIIASVPPQDS